MSEPLLGVIVTHATIGASLIDAVASITGSREGLVAVSNQGCGLETLRARIGECGDLSHCVVFVDLPGGSCYTAAATLRREFPGVAVVAGVNLPMLLDFVTHRDNDVATAVERALTSGAKGIRVVR
jgi:mannose/fructose-specific phosphotransferase system component IIA